MRKATTTTALAATITTSIIFTRTDALAQRCDPVQAEGIVVNEQRNARAPRIAASSAGLVVTWLQRVRNRDVGLYRAFDPNTLRPTGRPTRIDPSLANDAITTDPHVVALGDGRIVVAQCSCTPARASCTTVLAAGTGSAPQLALAQGAPASCGAAPFTVASAGNNLVAAVPFGANRTAISLSSASQASSALGASTALTAIGLDNDRVAFVRSAPSPGSIQLLNVPANSLTEVAFGDGALFIAPPIRLVAGLLTVVQPRQPESQPPTQLIVTYASGRSATTAPLTLPQRRTSNTTWTMPMITSLAPSSGGCFLAAWSIGNNQELYIARVCNGVVDTATQGVLRRRNGMLHPKLATDGQHAFVTWHDDTRSDNSVIRIAQLGCR